MPSKISSLMGMMGGQGGNNPMAMIMQMMNGKMNPEQMINSFIQQNPQMAEVWKQAQTMSNGKNPKEMEQMVRQMCQQKGIDFDQAQGMLNNINKNNKK